MGYEFESLQRSNGVEGILWPHLLSPRLARPTPLAVEALPAADTKEVPMEVPFEGLVDARQLATAGLKRRGRSRHVSQRIA